MSTPPPPPPRNRLEALVRQASQAERPDKLAERIAELERMRAQVIEARAAQWHLDSIDQQLRALRGQGDGVMPEKAITPPVPVPVPVQVQPGRQPAPAARPAPPAPTPAALQQPGQPPAARPAPTPVPQPAPTPAVLQPLQVQIVPEIRPSARPAPAPPPLEPIPQTQKISNKKKPGSKSKRETLGSLPADWRARIFAATGTIPRPKPRPPSQIRVGVAVLWATGCRPAELERGVELQMDGGHLVITIRAAKVGLIDNGDVIAQRGLEVRRLRLDPASTPATELLASLAANGPITVKHPKKSLRTRVNELGQEVLAKMRNPPSVAPYSFRHAMGCDLKSCDSLTDIQRAMTMGHLSTESLTKYGRRRRGGGGASPILDVEASAVPHGSRQPGQAEGQVDSQADNSRPQG
jgi:hypothetical protein